MRNETVQKLLSKVKEDYDRIAPEFSATRQYLWDDLKDFGRYVKDGDVVLDLGCGNGRLLELFRDKNINYTGIDSCKELIEVAEKKYSAIERSSDRAISGAKFLVGDILDLPACAGRPFAKEQFDVVFCIAAFHHIPSKELRLKCLDNIRNILKKDGWLVLTVWNLYQKKYLPYFLDYKTKLKKYQIFSWKDVFIPWKLKNGEKIWRYCRAFTKGELRHLSAQAGFEILKLESSRHNFIAILKK